MWKSILPVLLLKRALCIFTAHKRSLVQANIFIGPCLSIGRYLYDVTFCPMFLRRVSVQGGPCSGRSLSRGSLSRERVSVQGGLCQGHPRTENPSTQCGEERAVRILLECFLVYDEVTLGLTYMRLVGDLRFVHGSDQLHGVLWMNVVWETENCQHSIFFKNII